MWAETVASNCSFVVRAKSWLEALTELIAATTNANTVSPAFSDDAGVSLAKSQQRNIHIKVLACLLSLGADTMATASLLWVLLFLQISSGILAADPPGEQCITVSVVYHAA
jgi:hypothetical protein